MNRKIKPSEFLLIIIIAGILGGGIVFFKEQYGWTASIIFGIVYVAIYFIIALILKRKGIINLL